MVSLETTFLIDLRSGVPAAVKKAEAIESSGEVKCVTPPAAAELWVGAYRFGQRHVARTRALLDSLVLLEMDAEACEEAGRIGADLINSGETMGMADLLIAAVTKRHGQHLLTRDPGFGRVRGLIVETY